MPKFLNASFGVEGFPRELLGLNSWTTFTPPMIGKAGSFYDAAFMRSSGLGSSGYYIIVGGQTNISNYIVITSGAGITKYGSTTVGGINPISGVCSSASGIAGVSDQAIVVGGGTTIALSVYGTNYWYQFTDNSFLTSWGNWTGSLMLGARIETTVHGSKAVAFGITPSGGRWLSNKALGIHNNTDFTTRSVPGTSGVGGYIKGRVGQGGRVACLYTAGGALDVSAGGGDYGDAGMRVDSSTVSKVIDIDYGAGANQWIKVENNGLVYTAPNTWGANANPSWSQQVLPTGGFAGTGAIHCFAMDVPNTAMASPQSITHGFTTWYGIVVGGLDPNANPPLFSGVLLTKDFVHFIPVEIPGVSFLHNGVFPNDGDTYFRFTGNRLFVFNGYACNMSGPLGVNELLT